MSTCEKCGLEKAESLESRVGDLEDELFKMKRFMRIYKKHQRVIIEGIRK